MATGADRTNATPTHIFGHVLRPDELLERVRYDAAEPCAALRPWVERYWSVRWELAEGEVFPVSTLDDPSIHLTVERGDLERDGTTGAGIWVTGPVTRGRFDVRLRGRGSVVGVKFALGGTHAFIAQDLRALRDRTIPAAEWFGGAAARLADDAAARLAGGAAAARLGGEHAAAQAHRTPLPDPLPRGELPHDAVSAAPRLDAWLLERGPTEPADAPMLRRLLQLVEDPRVHSLADIERLSGLSTRTVQRAFERGLGVGVKRMLMRARVIDATAAIDRRDGRPLADIAAVLGWFDQSHFIRDFRAVTGETPARYARRADERSVLGTSASTSGSSTRSGRE